MRFNKETLRDAKQLTGRSGQAIIGQVKQHARYRLKTEGEFLLPNLRADVARKAAYLEWGDAECSEYEVTMYRRDLALSKLLLQCVSGEG